MVATYNGVPWLKFHMDIDCYIITTAWLGPLLLTTAAAELFARCSGSGSPGAESLEVLNGATHCETFKYQTKYTNISGHF